MDEEQARYYAMSLVDKTKAQITETIEDLVYYLCNEKARRNILLVGMSDRAKEELEKYEKNIEDLKLRLEIARLMKGRV